MNKPRTFWTDRQLALLRELYPDCKAESVAHLIERPIASVYQKAKQLGLEKSAAFKASDLSGRVLRGKQDPRMAVNRFAPGMRPWNKGEHYSAGGRSAETRFKPGHSPATQQAIGSLRIVNNNLERKVNNLPGGNHVRWHPVHRTLWIEAHGPLPAGHMVVFRKGMHTNQLGRITLDRLECISRAENAKRNHPRSKSPELAQLVQLKGAITRQVNRIQREADEARKSMP